MCGVGIMEQFSSRTPLANRVLGYRCHQVLNYVTRMIEEENTVPSYAMIADALGISTKGKVCEIVRRLERRGLLSRQTPRVWRARRIKLNGERPLPQSTVAASVKLMLR